MNLSSIASMPHVVHGSLPLCPQTLCAGADRRRPTRSLRAHRGRVWEISGAMSSHAARRVPTTHGLCVLAFHSSVVQP